MVVHLCSLPRTDGRGGAGRPTRGDRQAAAQLRRKLAQLGANYLDSSHLPVCCLEEEDTSLWALPHTPTLSRQIFVENKKFEALYKIQVAPVRV